MWCDFLSYSNSVLLSSKMSLTVIIFTIILVILLANLPWLSNRFMLFIPLKSKPLKVCVIEWLVNYSVLGVVTLGIEFKLTGGIHTQEWEFIVITLCVFAVFSMPGIIFRYLTRYGVFPVSN